MVQQFTARLAAKLGPLAPVLRRAGAGDFAGLHRMEWGGKTFCRANQLGLAWWWACLFFLHLQRMGWWFGKPRRPTPVRLSVACVLRGARSHVEGWVTGVRDGQGHPPARRLWEQSLDLLGLAPAAA